MPADGAAVALQPLDAGQAAYPPGVPAWLKAVDSSVIALLNVALVVEVVLVFASTMTRSLFNSSALMGIDEGSPLFLVTLSFLGGAVSYGRGQFIAITLLIDRARPAWNAFFKACAEWVVIIVSVLLGGYSSSCVQGFRSSAGRVPRSWRRALRCGALCCCSCS